MMRRLRNMMFTGLIALLPLYLSITLLVWLFKTVDAIFQPWLAQVFHITIPGLGILATALVVFVAGAVVSSVSGALILGWVDRLVDQVPILKSLYSGIKKIVESFNPNNPSGFKEFVLIEQSQNHDLSGGFLTGEFSLVKPDGTRRELVSIYVPSNHLYLGTIQIVDRTRIIKTSMTLQDGIAFTLSAGASTKGVVRELGSTLMKGP
ncbi:MAG: DUF502 domain-containing protein [Nitrospirae bacterium]|nr:DUF502 domain-containing protein [Nitrospirota bacterium]